MHGIRIEGEKVKACYPAGRAEGLPDAADRHRRHHVLPGTASACTVQRSRTIRQISVTGGVNPQRSPRGQPSTSVAEYGWMTSPVKAGLRPPPPAADGLDRACHPAFVGHQAFDGKERLKSKQRPCRLFSLRHLCADSDSHPHRNHGRSPPNRHGVQAIGMRCSTSFQFPSPDRDRYLSVARSRSAATPIRPTSVALPPFRSVRTS